MCHNLWRVATVIPVSSTSLTESSPHLHLFPGCNRYCLLPPCYHQPAQDKIYTFHNHWKLVPTLFWSLSFHFLLKLIHLSYFFLPYMKDSDLFWQYLDSGQNTLLDLLRTFSVHSFLSLKETTQYKSRKEMCHDACRYLPLHGIPTASHVCCF